MKEKILLVDGLSVLNRAFYAVPFLTNNDGVYTNAVFGFLNILFKFIDEESPEYLAVAFDVSRHTFRTDLYKEYKGTRKSTPDELREQVPIIKNLLKTMNIKCFELANFEADDILGTIAQKSEKDGFEAVIVTGDRDLLQIASNSIMIRIPKTKAGKTEVEDYKEKDVIEKIGVTPVEYIDVKALMGDASDNIPGVPSIGEKTALKIIKEFKSIENAIDNADKITPKKSSENIVLYKEQAILSKTLATILTDVPIEYKIDEMKYNKNATFNIDAYEQIKKLEFKSFFKKFDAVEQKSMEDMDRKVDYQYIKDKRGFLDSLSDKKIISYKLLGFDDIIGVSFSYANNEARLIIFNDSEKEDFLVKFFNTDIPKISIDLKHDMKLLMKYNIEPINVVFDVMLAGYILNSSKSKYEYNDIASEVLNESYPDSEEILGKQKTDFAYLSLSDEDILKFACDQSNVIFKAYIEMDKRISQNGQENLYYEIEHPLIKVLYEMESLGIKINKDELIKYGEKLDVDIERLTGMIHFMSGDEFNINSPKQLGVVLFEKLGLKGGKKTKTGYSTANDVLEKLKDKHDIIGLIMEYRSLTKLKSTYVDGLLNAMNPKTNKIHSTFNQAITTTGRISSTEPNLQNIPIRTELGRELRKIFIPSGDSFVFADADYSQIELRLLAHMSGDEILINAFKNGMDIHRLTASQVFNTPFDEVTKSQRSNAKAVNFGIIYGINGFSLGEDLGITTKEANTYIEEYFNKYPKVREYLDNTITQAHADGYAATIYGRRRNIPELKSQNFNEKSFGERIAMNMPVQGSAADIIKIVMVRLFDELKKRNLKSRLILQVHDEVLLEVDKNEIDEVNALVVYVMENAAKLLVPLEADINTGNNWYEAH